MKILLIFLLFFSHSNINCFEVKKDISYFREPKKVRFDKFVLALTMVESCQNNKAINKKENARGAFQIRPIRLKDFNKKAGKNYSIEQMHDYNIAREIFLYYADSTNLEATARKWNGGPLGMKKKSTVKYWNKIKQML